MRPNSAADHLLAAVLCGGLAVDWPHIEASWHAQIDPIPHHTLVPILGAHHYVMFDAPAPYFAAVDDFLASLPR